MSLIANAKNSFDLSQTRLLITGAAGGIGAATARCCGKMGARLVLADVTQLEMLEPLAHELPGTVPYARSEVKARRAGFSSARLRFQRWPAFHHS